jgi:hypothetical protein
MLKKLLLTGATFLALTTMSNAVVIGELGINPTSSQGAFSNHFLPVGSAFADQWTFQLVGEQLLTIGSATNVYPSASDFILGFNGSVFEIVGAIGGGDDVLVLGPAFAIPCGNNCQVFGGSAILDAGSYYLSIAGTALGPTASYSGDLAVVAAPVPGPTAGSFSIGSLLALLK